jgi:hypothetical protein
MDAFDLDFSGDSTGLARILLADRLRGPKRLAWLACLLSGVSVPYAALMAFREDYLYWLAHGPQVCFIQGALNDVFDNVGRGIYISDGPRNFPVYVYRAAEEKPVYVGRISEAVGVGFKAPLYMFRIAECVGTGVDFIVNVPHAVSVAAGYDVNRLKGIVNKLKLPNKSYSVVVF